MQVGTLVEMQTETVSRSDSFRGWLEAGMEGRGRLKQDGNNHVHCTLLYLYF
jgi:hypothetical protein